jgi:small conductance mechanosensitive channel
MPDIEVQPLRILSEKLETTLATFISLLPNIIAAVLLLVLTWIIAVVARWLLGQSLRRSKMREALRQALITLIATAIWIAGIVIAATVLLPGLTAAKLLAGLGLGSIAIGLAFKDIFENFLAGLLIMMRQPMRIGDFIECEDVSGKVERITIRDTYLRRTDGVLVLLPNAFLYKNAVRVLTDRDTRRERLIVGIAYGEDVAQGRAVIQKALEGVETVDQAQPVQVFAHAFSSSSIDFEITWWTGSRPVDVRRSRDQVVEAIKAALNEAGIEIPFPYRTLTFKEPLTLNRGAAANDEPASA